ARCPGSGYERDLPAHVRAGEVVLSTAARGASDNRDLGLNASRAGAAANAFGEVDPRPVAFLARREDRHCGQVDDRHREVLEERAAVARRLEADLAEALRHIRGRIEVPHGSRVATGADALARFHRQRGDDVFFLTGTDDNATKNEQAAKAAGVDTRTFVDRNAAAFKRLCDTWNISYDRFIRTVDPDHIAGVQEFVR